MGKISGQKVISKKGCNMGVFALLLYFLLAKFCVFLIFNCKKRNEKLVKVTVTVTYPTYARYILYHHHTPINNQCCGSGSGIQCPFDPWIQDPVRVKNQYPDPEHCMEGGWAFL